LLHRDVFSNDVSERLQVREADARVVGVLSSPVEDLLGEEVGVGAPQLIVDAVHVRVEHVGAEELHAADRDPLQHHPLRRAGKHHRDRIPRDQVVTEHRADELVRRNGLGRVTQRQSSGMVVLRLALGVVYLFVQTEVELADVAGDRVDHRTDGWGLAVEPGVVGALGGLERLDDALLGATTQHGQRVPAGRHRLDDLGGARQGLLTEGPHQAAAA
jgi:hypothetical protein